jgi:hypothetical protein
MSEKCFLKLFFGRGQVPIVVAASSRGSKRLEHLVFIEHWGKQGINFGCSEIL